MAAVVASERAAERVGATLRQQLFERAMTLSLRWHDRTRSGELVSRLTTDVGRMLDALVAVCATLVPDAVRLSLVLIALVLIDPTLAVVAVAVLPLLLILAIRQRRLGRRGPGRRPDRVGSVGRAGASTSSATSAPYRPSAVRTVPPRRSRRATAGHSRPTSSPQQTEARWAPRADVILALGTGLVLAIGGRQAVAGSLGAGQLIVVMSYLSALYSPIRSLSRLSGVLAKSTASAARLEQVLRLRRADREPTGCATRSSSHRFSAAGARPVRLSRGHAGPGRVRPRGPCGGDGVSARAERYRQEHGPAPAAAPLRRRRRCRAARRRRRARVRPRRSASPDGLRSAGSLAARRVDRRQHRVRFSRCDPARNPASRRHRPASTSSSTACRTATTRSSARTRPRCPAVSGAGSPWPGPLCRRRRWSCSTSPPRPSTALRPTGSSTRSAGRPPAGPSSSPRTTRTWPPSRTGS